jgi:Domain of unknown function (DUF4190)
VSSDFPPPPPPHPPPPGNYGGGSYPPPPGGYFPPGGPLSYGPTNNQKAIVALVTGIVGLLCCGPLGLVAIIFGVLARKEIDAAGGMQKGSGMALGGILLGIISLAWMVVAVALGLYGAVLPS